MAQVIIVRWKERNKKLISGIRHLQTLYDHDTSLFTIGDLTYEPTTKEPETVERLKGGLPKITNKSPSNPPPIADSIEFTLRMPFSADEFSLNLESSFSSVEEMLPSSVQKGVGLYKTLQQISGKANASFTNLFGFQVWEKTAPIELNLEFMFNTVKSGWLDVWAPMMSLCAQSILSIDEVATVSDATVNGEKGQFVTFTPANTYRTPGVSLPNLSFFQKAKERQAKADGKEVSQSKPGNGEKKNEEFPKDVNANTKVVSIEIPGMVILETALIKSAKPIFSKEITESGAPLWGKLDLSIQSVTPAHDGLIFQSGLNQIAKLRKKTLGDKLEGFIKNNF